MPISLEAACKDRGTRVNATRRIVLDLLEHMHGHPTADEIFRRALNDRRDISLPTIYRTINMLIGLGLVRRLELSDGKARFEPVTSDHHDHLIDMQHGEVVDLRDPKIEQTIREVASRLGYTLVDYRLELFAKSKTETRCI